MVTYLRHLILLLILAAAIASEAPAEERTHDVTIEDYFTQAYITECVLAPDGGTVAYVERRWQGPKEPGNSDVWLVDCNSKVVRRVTFDPSGESGVRWSPDSKSLYFLSRRKREGEKLPPYNNTTQVWCCEVSSGREIPVTRAANGVNAFRLSSDGQRLYFTTSQKYTTDDWKELKTEFGELNYGHGIHKVSELWKLDLVSWREARVFGQKRYIHFFDVSPDEKQIALITAPDDLGISNEGESQVDLLDVSNGALTTLPDHLWRAKGPSPYGWLEDPAWSGDGQQLAFTVHYDGFPAELFVCAFSDGEPRVRKMPRPTDAFLVGGVAWRGKSNDVCFLGDFHATKAVFVVRDVQKDKPRAEALAGGDFVIDGVSFSPNGEKMALLQTGATYGRDVFLAAAQDAGERTRLTNVNPQIDTWKLPKIERISWKGAKGDQVEGILELPPDGGKTKPLATIVNLHGGPTGSDYVGFQYWPYGRTLLASKGYAVFYPNYRGSTGYGDDFLVDLIGHENEIEVEDILKGIDALVDQGIADKTRLGVMGWSNGGYLTNCLITGTDRFKAASSGAGVFDMTIQWGEEDTPGHVVNYQQGLPWKQAEKYQKTSPLYQLKSESFRTATLIHVGENDERVPAAHSKALHRALHKYLKDVHVELVMYPNAGHSLTEYGHRLAKLKWEQAWFEKYLPAHAK